ncbi:MAG: 4Fe-4S binding protein [Desulfocapsa sp.]|nr:4Fe-4S binding protein [Desulfocapsa sp.]
MQKILSPGRFRLVIQTCFVIFFVYIGFRFIAFLAWAGGTSETFVSKPGAIEGFLPISALLGLRWLTITGEWDVVHPAGLSIFLAVLLIAFLCRKGFCGYICPVGFLSNVLERVGRSIHLARIPPKWLDIPLIGLKYILLGGFCYAVFSMSEKALGMFIHSSYNMTSDAQMLAFFLHPSLTSMSVFGGLFVCNIVIRNFWCRYLCPYGALLGLLAWVGPVHIMRRSSLCIDCGKCSKHCPSGISVHEKKMVRSAECIGCVRCVEVCPVTDCLSVVVLGRKSVSWKFVGIASVAVLLLVWAWAKLYGRWESEMPLYMLKRIYTSGMVH